MMSTTKKEKEIEERSLTGDSDKDSRGSSSNGDPPRLEAPQGATGQNPKSPETSETPASREGHSLSGTENPGNLEVLTEKVGTLGLQGQKKNRSGAAKKRARRARLVEAPAGDSAGGQPPLQGSQKEIHQRPSISGPQDEVQRPSTSGLSSQKAVQPEQGPGKRQRSSGGTPDGGQAKRPKRLGQPSYVRAAQGGLRMAIICDGYPKEQVSNENFSNIQRAIGRLVDELPEEGFTPKLLDTYWTKGAVVAVCQDEETRDWLGKEVPNMKAWEGSRLRMVGLEALPTYKRVVGWFPGPVEDTERLLARLRRLNRGLETSQWRVYERKEEPRGVRLVLSIDSESAATLERMKWRPFSGTGQAVFSLLGAKPEGK